MLRVPDFRWALPSSFLAVHVHHFSKSTFFLCVIDLLLLKRILFTLKIFWKATSIYSPPPSLWKGFSLHPVCSSDVDRRFPKHPKTSAFALVRKTVTYFDASSLDVTKYRASHFGWDSTGLCTSVWTSSSSYLSLCSKKFSIFARVNYFREFTLQGETECLSWMRRPVVRFSDFKWSMLHADACPKRLFHMMKFSIRDKCL